MHLEKTPGSPTPISWAAKPAVYFHLSSINENPEASADPSPLATWDVRGLGRVFSPLALHS